LFSYYGSKSKIIKYYPRPAFGTIVEPFAGSARYSLLYPKKVVILNDLDEVIYNIWNYLIHASEEDIKKLPDIKKGESLEDLDILQVEKDLLGYMVRRGNSKPGSVWSDWAYKGNEIEKSKKKIRFNLPNIRHWKVTCKSYEELDNIEATWFIDPPYQYGGKSYAVNKIDYSKLGEWCKSRNGQAIVCENSKADWMDFQPLVRLSGQRGKSIEVMWTNRQPKTLFT
jgi:site-specific DNA-adenine methylase